MADSKEIFTYAAPWPVYGLSWSARPSTFRLALSSFQQDFANKLQVIQVFPGSESFTSVVEAEHPFPVTKLKWSPYKGGRAPDLFATTGDYLRLWEFVTGPEDTANSLDSHGKPLVTPGLIQRATLANVRKSGQTKKEYAAPITSFDWNEADPRWLVTSSIDTTCTIWDLQAQVAKTQLIAHDKEVFDVAFAKGTDIFASVGADGSVRMFDLRSLEHSTIIYETPPKPSSSSSSSTATAECPPLLRLAWNKQDSNYIATFQSTSSSVLILDIRVPAVPVAELSGHSGPLNSIAWAPHSSGHICSTGDDGQALIWDVTQMTKSKVIQDPILAYGAPAEVNSLAWNGTATEWVAIAFGNTVQALRV